jgi:uncharacterized protein
MSELWRMLEGVPAYRVTEIPQRAAVTDDSRESSIETGTDRGQRVAALAAAYHAGLAAGTGAAGGAAGTAGAGGAGGAGTAGAAGEGDRKAEKGGNGTVGFGWVRLESDGPVHVVAAGEAVRGSTIDGQQVLLALPGGARASRIAGLPELLDRLPVWREIAGISDGLLAEERPHTARLEDVLLGSWVASFGWMLMAEPIQEDELRKRVDDTAARLHLVESTADRFPARALDAERLRHRLAELGRGFSTGMWRVRLLAGGADEVAAARVAGLFCASVDLSELPYAIAPGTTKVEDLVAATEFVAAVACPPRVEIPGIRLALRPEFDTTPEHSEQHEENGIKLGEIRDHNMMPAGTFHISHESLNRHVFVAGATGSGKSHTIKSALAQTAIPWLVIEPAKAEYREVAEIRIRPGDPDAIPAGVNPLEPAPGFPLQTHADLTKALFVNSFRSEEPFPQVLSAAITRAYTNKGWDLALGEPIRPGARYPTLEDLQREAEHVVAEIGYSQRVTDDVLGFMKVRLASLCHGTTGQFLTSAHPIDFGKLLTSNVVLEIEDVGDDRDKAFLMGTVLIRLAEHLRTGGQRKTLSHLTVVEEAHRLLRRPAQDDGPDSYAVEMFASLLAELRAYGEGLIIVDQIPAKLISDAIKNTAVKITHRLPAAEDREAVGATMNLNDAQSRYLVTLRPGEAAVFSDGMDNPILVKMPGRDAMPAAATGTPASIVGRRSSTCGADCVARPCTLREMHTAQRTVANLPLVRLWIELTVLAHLAGWPMPVPRETGWLGELPSRTRDCLLAQAVDNAVKERNAGTGLAEHVATAIRCRVTRDMWLCQATEHEWRREPVDKVSSFGVKGPSAVEEAVGALRTEPKFGECLAAALESFTDCRWPLDYLTLRRRRRRGCGGCGRDTEVRTAGLDGGRVGDVDRGHRRSARGRRYVHRVAGLHRADARGLRVHDRGAADRVAVGETVGALHRDRRRADRGNRAALNVDGLIGTVLLAYRYLAMLDVADARAEPDPAESWPEALAEPRPRRLRRARSRRGGRAGVGRRGGVIWGVAGGGVSAAGPSGYRHHRDARYRHGADVPPGAMRNFDEISLLLIIHGIRYRAGD